MTDVKIKGSRKHEEDFAELIGGTRVPGSGSQWHNKGDAANQHHELFAIRGDCKCTQGQSISVSRAMIRKLLEDAGGELPALPLRFYKNEHLDIEYDLVAVLSDDFGELLENARQNAAAQEALAEYEALKTRVAEAMIVNVPDHFTDEQVAEFHRQLTEAMESGQQVRWADPKDSAHVPDETFAAMSAALIAAQDRQAELEAKATEQKERTDDLARQLREANAELMRRRGDDLERSQMAQEQVGAGVVVQSDPGELERLRLELAQQDQHLLESHQENDRIVGLLHDASQKLEALRAAPPAPQPDASVPLPVDIPQLPWMVVSQLKLPGGQIRNTGVWWDANGRSHPVIISEVRTEPTGPHTQRLVVNNRVVREGDLVVSGQLKLRVGAR